jgi:hypothetical protein
LLEPKFCARKKNSNWSKLSCNPEWENSNWSKLSCNPEWENSNWRKLSCNPERELLMGSMSMQKNAVLMQQQQLMKVQGKNTP